MENWWLGLMNKVAAHFFFFLFIMKSLKFYKDPLNKDVSIWIKKSEMQNCTHPEYIYKTGNYIYGMYVCMYAFVCVYICMFMCMTVCLWNHGECFCHSCLFNG